MNGQHSFAIGLIGAATALALLLIAARALLPRLARNSRAAAERRIESFEATLDWAVHFAVGFMILSILTIPVVASFDRTSAIAGGFAGVGAALMAYLIARPPVRFTARNPELDGRMLGVSTLVHLATGIALAKLLIATAGQ